ncbi:hypothetical protein CCP2SC5_260026 [Azospirillaceae bacterium]
MRVAAGVTAVVYAGLFSRLAGERGRRVFSLAIKRFRAASRFGASFAVLVACGAASGCGDEALDRGMTFGYLYEHTIGTPTIAAPSPPSPVRRMSEQNPAWPTFDSMPTRPDRPPTLSEYKEEVARLTEIQQQGRLADELLREIAPPPPDPAKMADPAKPAKPDLAKTGASKVGSVKTEKTKVEEKETRQVKVDSKAPSMIPAKP